MNTISKSSPVIIYRLREKYLYEIVKKQSIRSGRRLCSSRKQWNGKRVSENCASEMATTQRRKKIRGWSSNFLEAGPLNFS